MRRHTTTIALVLVLAACSPGNGGSDSTTTTMGDSEQTTTTESADTTTTETAETTSTEPQGSEGASCVEGEWNLNPEVFVAVMESAAAGEADLGDAEITPSDGTYRVTMGSNGTFTGEREDWGFSVVTADGTFNIRMNGSESGTWSADDTTITVMVVDSDMTVDAVAEFDGQTFNLPESPVDVPDAIAESSTYTCDGSTLAVTTDGITITLERA